MIKPIIVHLTPPGPNSWKAVFILEELGIPYEIRAFRVDNVKDKAFTDINPNGRVPAIQDPNTDLTLWESGAIVQYVIEQYDSEKRLCYEDLKGRHLCNQWLQFQMSGQGPYYGVAGWFNVLHPEKLPSAIDRYNKQARRVLEVLDGWLDGKEWLVGDKMTYADLAWAPWNDRYEWVVWTERATKFDDFPNLKAWHERMISLPSWKRTMEHREKLMIEQQLQATGIPKGVKNQAEYEAKMKRDKEEASTLAQGNAPK